MDINVFNASAKRHITGAYRTERNAEAPAPVRLPPLRSLVNLVAVAEAQERRLTQTKILKGSFDRPLDLWARDFADHFDEPPSPSTLNKHVRFLVRKELITAKRDGREKPLRIGPGLQKVYRDACDAPAIVADVEESVPSFSDWIAEAKNLVYWTLVLLAVVERLGLARPIRELHAVTKSACQRLGDSEAPPPSNLLAPLRSGTDCLWYNEDRDIIVLGDSERALAVRGEVDEQPKSVQAKELVDILKIELENLEGLRLYEIIGSWMAVSSHGFLSALNKTATRLRLVHLVGERFGRNMIDGGRIACDDFLTDMKRSWEATSSSAEFLAGQAATARDRRRKGIEIIHQEEEEVAGLDHAGSIGLLGLRVFHEMYGRFYNGPRPLPDIEHYLEKIYFQFQKTAMEERGEWGWQSDLLDAPWHRKYPNLHAAIVVFEVECLLQSPGVDATTAGVADSWASLAAIKKGAHGETLLSFLAERCLDRIRALDVN